MDAMDLNPEQLRVAQQVEGAMLMLAGPGTGKTRVLASRVEYLIKDVSAHPNQICVLTFTTKAATELKKRLHQLLETEIVAEIQISTLHSLALRILIAAWDIENDTDVKDGKRNRGRRPEVIDPLDAFDLLKRAVDHTGLDMALYDYRSVWDHLAIWKSGARRRDTLSEDLREVLDNYEGLLRVERKWDLSDLVVNAHQAILDNGMVADALHFDYMLVDEFQDTSEAEFELILSLSGKNVLFAGAEAQSIYAWRGAKFELLDAQVRQRFPEIERVVLRHAYRSGQTILDAAGAFVPEYPEVRLSSAVDRANRVLVADFASEMTEAHGIAREIKQLHTDFGVPYEDMAILVRVLRQTPVLEDALAQLAVPYSIFGEHLPFWSRPEVRTALGYMTWALYLGGAKDAPTAGMLDLIINTPPRGIDPATIRILKRGKAELEWGDLVEGMTDVELRDQAREELKQLFYNLTRLSRQVNAIRPEKLLDEILEFTDWEFWLREELHGGRKVDTLRELRMQCQEYRTTREFVLDIFANQHIEMDGVGVSLATIHAAKGLEWDAVFLPGWVDGILPHYRAKQMADDPAEERRLAHVAVSRARRIAFISTYRMRLNLKGREVYASASPFIQMLRNEEGRLNRSRLPGYGVSSLITPYLGEPVGAGIYEQVSHSFYQEEDGFDF
jgi:superfamily I DNA/RNA helicase